MSPVVTAMEYGFLIVPITVGAFLRNCAISNWAYESYLKIISGYFLYFVNSLVSWSAVIVKQHSISLSSTEAEYFNNQSYE